MHKIYISNSYNPFFNLALEEYIAKQHSSKDEVLFLWQNQNTVVIGRNQNPWKECNLEELKSQQGQLVRRLSGGGAVYHDLGNLNFSFISDYCTEKIKNNINKIIKALELSGINAYYSGKNDILADGYKISGTAFYLENDTLCQHGTLLVDVDLEKMSRMLTVSQKKMQSKGIDSVKSRVVNINSLNSEISIESLKKNLIKIFSSSDKKVSISTINYGSEDSISDNMAEAYKLMETYKSWQWNYGSSPEFNLEITEKFPWGEIDIYLLVIDGIITKVEVYTDALEVDIPKKITERVQNTKYDYNKIMGIIATIKS